MDWKQFYDKGMVAMMAGDDGQCIGAWKQAVSLVEQKQPAPTTELGQLYYGLGKTLPNDSLDEKIALLTEAERILISVDSAHAMLTQVRYDLGNFLARAGKSDQATTMLKQALNIEDGRHAKCLDGTPHEALAIKPLIKALQKQALAKELDAREFKKLKKALIEKGVADDDEDDDSIHPFDLFFEYYQTLSRAEADHCAFWEADSTKDFNAERKSLDALINRLNTLLGEKLTKPADVRVLKVPPRSATSGDQLHCLAIDDTIGVPIFDVVADVVHFYNLKLSQRKDERRIVRMASYDDRELVLLLAMKKAASLYLAGAGELFEDLNIDLEPELLERDPFPLK